MFARHADKAGNICLVWTTISFVRVFCSVSTLYLLHFCCFAEYFLYIQVLSPLCRVRKKRMDCVVHNICLDGVVCSTPCRRYSFHIYWQITKERREGKPERFRLCTLWRALVKSKRTICASPFRVIRTFSYTKTPSTTVVAHPLRNWVTWW